MTKVVWISFILQTYMEHPLTNYFILWNITVFIKRDLLVHMIIVLKAGQAVCF